MEVKKLKKIYGDKFTIAHKYFSILSILNDFKLERREIDLLAFISVKGTIDSKSSRDEFVKAFCKGSIATLNNTISKLYTKEILKKIEGKKRINPLIMLDFNQLEFIDADKEKLLKASNSPLPNEFKMEIRCLYKEKKLTIELLQPSPIGIQEEAKN